jgi:hypothetical protein
LAISIRVIGGSINAGGGIQTPFAV